eukprot:TRINITY_DN9627_c0_g2_i1.p1 TRINITY_DN9627_c0_g2~~TRINITY_DN9627_c0_g2_i1.p1  ORF type:complete len:114 (-),score=32.50 TRINITY_DN9627_c0_g2_i1:414-755(-)
MRVTLPFVMLIKSKGEFVIFRDVLFVRQRPIDLPMEQRPGGRGMGGSGEGKGEGGSNEVGDVGMEDRDGIGDAVTEGVGSGEGGNAQPQELTHKDPPLKYPQQDCTNKKVGMK